MNRVAMFDTAKNLSDELINISKKPKYDKPSQSDLVQLLENGKISLLLLKSLLKLNPADRSYIQKKNEISEAIRIIANDNQIDRFMEESQDNYLIVRHMEMSMMDPKKTTYEEESDSKKENGGTNSRDLSTKEKVKNTIYTGPMCALPSFNTEYAGGDAIIREINSSFENKKLVNLPDKSIPKNRASGLLLVGPPGTGKSLFARCLARQFNSSFMSLTASVAKDSYYGGSDKVIEEMFNTGRELVKLNGSCIIFIDEIDGILSKDSHNGGSIGVFLVQMDGSNNNNEGLIVIGATNHPNLLPENILERFPKIYFLGLPDAQDTRKLIFQKLKLFQPQGVLMTNIDWDNETVAVTKDLKNLDEKNEVDNYPIDEHVFPIQKKDMEDTSYDTVDIIGSAFLTNFYSARNIDNIFNLAYSKAIDRSVNFVKYDDDDLEYQMWLLDESETEVTDSKTCQTIKKRKSLLFPIGFCDIDGKLISKSYKREDKNGNTIENRVEPIGSLYYRKISKVGDKKVWITVNKCYDKGLKCIITKRQKKTEEEIADAFKKLVITDMSDIDRTRMKNDMYSYTVKKIYSNGKWLNTLNAKGDVHITDNLFNMLCLAQISIQDILDSMRQIKPATFRDSEGLALFSKSRAYSFKDDRDINLLVVLTKVNEPNSDDFYDSENIPLSELDDVLTSRE